MRHRLPAFAPRADPQKAGETMSERITPRIDWLTVDALDEARAAAGHCAAAVADVLIAATVGTLADQFGTARL